MSETLAERNVRKLASAAVFAALTVYTQVKGAGPGPSDPPPSGLDCPHDPTDVGPD